MHENNGTCASEGNFAIGLLFGNLNEDDQVELDYLDEDEREQVLSVFHKIEHEATDIKQLLGEGKTEGIQADAGFSCLPTAVDFEDEQDLAPDYAPPSPSLLRFNASRSAAAASTSQRMNIWSSGGVDDDYDDEEPMPTRAMAAPPSIPKPVFPARPAEVSDEEADFDLDDELDAALDEELDKLESGQKGDQHQAGVMEDEIHIDMNFYQQQEAEHAAWVAMEEPVRRRSRAIELNMPLLAQSEQEDVIHFTELFGDEAVDKLRMNREYRREEEEERQKQAAAAARRLSRLGRKKAAGEADVVRVRAVDDEDWMQAVPAQGTGVTGTSPAQAGPDADGKRAGIISAAVAGEGAADEDASRAGAQLAEENRAVTALEKGHCRYSQCPLHDPSAVPIPLDSTGTQLVATHAQRALAHALEQAQQQSRGPAFRHARRQVKLAYGSKQRRQSSMDNSTLELSSSSSEESWQESMLGFVPEQAAATVCGDSWEKAVEELCWRAARSLECFEVESETSEGEVVVTRQALHRNESQQVEPVSESGRVPHRRRSASQSPTSRHPLPHLAAAGAAQAAEAKGGFRSAELRNRPAWPRGLHPQMLRLEPAPKLASKSTAARSKAGTEHAGPSSETRPKPSGSERAQQATSAQLGQAGTSMEGDRTTEANRMSCKDDSTVEEIGKVNELQPALFPRYYFPSLSGDGWLHTIPPASPHAQPSSASVPVASRHRKHANHQNHKHIVHHHEDHKGPQSAVPAPSESLLHLDAGGAPIVMDLHDRDIVFEADDADALAGAAAIVLPRPPRPPLVTGPPMVERDDVATEIAVFNISREHAGTDAKKGQVDKAAIPKAASIHCQLANNLATLPTTLKEEQLAAFHRPRSKWGLEASGGAITLLQSARANSTPSIESGAPLRPPGAFRRQKQLTAKEGHMLVLEYLEERPPLIAHRGMGARLMTYYQKHTDNDLGHTPLVVAAAGGAPAAGGIGGPGAAWMVGTVQPLPPGSTSLFMGSLAPGASVLAVEAAMFRAPAAPHHTRTTDFLLVRSPRGELSLREITGTVSVGQQHPHVRVPMPGSSSAAELASKHVQVFVIRHLLRLRKKTLADAPATEHQIGIQIHPHLQQSFRHIPVKELKRILTDVLNLVESRNDNNTYLLPSGGKLPEGGDLRKLITPDQVCALHSMYAASHELSKLGLVGLNADSGLLAAPIDRVKLALEQLNLDSPQIAKAATALEDALIYSPWSITDTFLWALREKRGLALDRDPTGTGRFFGFKKEQQRKPTKEEMNKDQGPITGTNADLRRLGFAEAGEILVKFGLERSLVDQINDRWKRIGMVRRLSSAAAADGRAGAGSMGSIAARFARELKVSLADQQAAFRDACQTVFSVQVQALREDREWEPVAPAAATGASERKGGAGAAGPSNNAAQEEEDIAAMKELAAMGLIRGDVASKHGPDSKGKGPKAAAAGASTSEGGTGPKPGDRRLRRTVIFTNANGGKTKKEIIYSDKEQIALLNLLTTGKEIGTFGERRIVGPGRVKLLKADTQKAAVHPLNRKMYSKGPPGRKRNKQTDRDEELEEEGEETVSEEDAMEYEKAKAKRGPRKPIPEDVLICPRCGEPGHGKLSKKCPFYSEPVAPVEKLSNMPSVTTVTKLKLGKMGKKLQGGLGSPVSAVSLEAAPSVPSIVLPKIKLKMTLPPSTSVPMPEPSVSTAVPMKPSTSAAPLLVKRTSMVASLSEEMSPDVKRPAKKMRHIASIVGSPMEVSTAARPTPVVTIATPSTETRKPTPSSVNKSMRSIASAAPVPIAPFDPALAAAAAEALARQKEFTAQFKVHIKKVIDEMKAMPCARFFLKKVEEKIITDYHLFVKKEDMMYIDKMASRNKNNNYPSYEAFHKDIIQMKMNCKAYNTPHAGKDGDPCLIQDAEALEEVVIGYRQRTKELRDLEARAQVEMHGVVHDEWIQCCRCDSWRRVDKETVERYKNDDWYCEFRQNTTCNDPQDEGAE